MLYLRGSQARAGLVLRLRQEPRLFGEFTLCLFARSRRSSNAELALEDALLLPLQHPHLQ